MVILASLGVALLFFEGVARLAPSAWGFAPKSIERRVICSSERMFGTSHPTLGWTGYPNARYFEQKTPVDGWQSVSIDQDGFRRTPGNPPVARNSLFILGDSVAFGTLASDDQTIAARLQAAYPDLRVRNLGIGGYGTGQEWLSYREVRDKAPHRLVILLYSTGTDWRNNAEPDRFAPRFTPRAGGSPVITPPSLSGPGNRNRGEKGWLGRIVDRSYLYGAIDRTIKGRRPHRAASTDLSSALRITRSLVLALADETRAAGARLLIAAMSSPHEFTGAKFLSIAKAQIAVLREFAEEREDVEFLSLFEVLSASDIAVTYGRQDGHPTPYGYDFVAKKIAEAIAEHGLHETQARAWPQYVASAPVEPDCSRFPQ